MTSSAWRMQGYFLSYPQVLSLQRTLFSLTLTCLSSIYPTQCDDSPPELRSAQEYLKLLRPARLACILQVCTISWNGLCTGIHSNPMKYTLFHWARVTLAHIVSIASIYRSLLGVNVFFRQFSITGPSHVTTPACSNTQSCCFPPHRL